MSKTGERQPEIAAASKAGESAVSRAGETQPEIAPERKTGESSRLQKILSSYGIASRREAEKMISAGRICVNGVVASIGQSAIPDKDLITIDGKPLVAKDNAVYIMLNKPRGYLTTVSDDRDRNTVMELVGDVGTRVYPIGRLDMDSEGLLLFTNDGDFANLAAHPSNGKTKTYEVRASGNVKKAAQLLMRPIMIDGHTVRAVMVKLMSATDSGGRLRITIQEGRNRQIRKMCDACEIKVNTLRRISLGDLTIGTLEVGKWRYLTKDEVNSICNLKV